MNPATELQAALDDWLSNDFYLYPSPDQEQDQAEQEKQLPASLPPSALFEELPSPVTSSAHSFPLSTPTPLPTPPTYSAPDPPTSPIQSRQTMEAQKKLEEKIARKRQRNTDAARRSRLRKALKMNTLEQRCSELEADNARLEMRLALLTTEKAGLETREREHAARVQKLEEQLTLAQRALEVLVMERAGKNA
ncbi:uncharacterized protein VTP21DRAFT_1344 [Calcarisporiella thermophila]|uniref:uncharacterized protein n=1 Tax=Calcarisporiella thermophila TaxID=911321 RepID=UPI0037446297